MARRVGLTGNIGSGKSTVARLLRERGAAVIDADALAREATGDPEVLRRIARELGPELVRAGSLDRERVAALVFADEGARRRLEAIVHPWVRRRAGELERRLREPGGPPVIVHDVPLLFESGLEGGMDLVVVVSAPLELRLARLARRGGLTREQALARERAQLPQEEKARRADWVLDNSGDAESLAGQVDRLWRHLLRQG